MIGGTTATEQRINPSSRLPLVLAPIFPAPPPTKVTAAGTEGKMQPMIISDSALPPRPLGTYRLHREASHKATPSRPGYVTVSSNFIQSDKVKENGNTEFVQVNEQEKTKETSNETKVMICQRKSSKH